MKILVDAMGGDNAPQAIVEGAAQIKIPGCEIILVGNTAKIKAAIKASGKKIEPESFSYIEAASEIDMHDDPVEAIRAKRDSSMSVALYALRDGQGDCLVSAGSTGALLTGATLIVKRVRGVRRAAAAPVLPSTGNGFVLIDSGANIECTPEMLLQFAQMGSIYAGTALGIKNARVGLLNNGAEDTKGGDLQLETFKLLKQAHEIGKMNFIGNVEGRDPILGACDIVVCDGFSGNIFLKASEGAALFVMKQLKNALTSSKKSKLAALMMRKRLDELKALANPDTVGGTILLGISKPVIKAHGGSNDEAIASAILHAIKVTNADTVGKLTEGITRLFSSNE